jgi:predicted nucleic acid-binding protein
MTSTLIDINVLVDVVEMRPVWSDWAARQMARLSQEGALLINQIIYAEASVPYATIEDFELVMKTSLMLREDMPWSAGFRAGKAFLQYRRKGGPRQQVLPDFMIAAHAAVNGHRLLTRDGARFSLYFPEVELVTPDTHP